MAHAQKPDLVFRRWASVQSTTGSRGVRISGSNAGYTMFRGSMKGTGYPLHSPVSPSLLPPPPCFTVCHHVSTGLYQKSRQTFEQGVSVCKPFWVLRYLIQILVYFRHISFLISTSRYQHWLIWRYVKLVNKANLMHNLFLVYLSIYTCFGRLCAHHQEKQL